MTPSSEPPVEIPPITAYLDTSVLIAAVWKPGRKAGETPEHLAKSQRMHARALSGLEGLLELASDIVVPTIALYEFLSGGDELAMDDLLESCPEFTVEPFTRRHAFFAGREVKRLHGMKSSAGHSRQQVKLDHMLIAMAAVKAKMVDESVMIVSFDGTDFRPTCAKLPDLAFCDLAVQTPLQALEEHLSLGPIS